MSVSNSHDFIHNFNSCLVSHSNRHGIDYPSHTTLQRGACSGTPIPVTSGCNHDGNGTCWCLCNLSDLSTLSNLLNLLNFPNLLNLPNFPNPSITLNTHTNTPTRQKNPLQSPLHPPTHQPIIFPAFNVAYLVFISLFHHFIISSFPHLLTFLSPSTSPSL